MSRAAEFVKVDPGLAIPVKVKRPIDERARAVEIVDGFIDEFKASPADCAGSIVLVLRSARALIAEE